MDVALLLVGVGEAAPLAKSAPGGVADGDSLWDALVVGVAAIAAACVAWRCSETGLLITSPLLRCTPSAIRACARDMHRIVCGDSA